MQYVATHRDFTPPDFLKGDGWMILSSNPLKNEYPVSYTLVKGNKWDYIEQAMNELYQWLFVYEKTDSEWVSLHQYRRYIDYSPEEVILPQPYLMSMHEQYRIAHNINDLLRIEDIIDEYYPEYRMNFSSINCLYPCNMFQGPRDLFNEWFEFVGGVLDIFSEKENFNDMDDIRWYVEDNMRYYSDKRLNYQVRLHGFLAERIGTIFWLRYAMDNNFKTLPINTVSAKEETYK